MEKETFLSMAKTFGLDIDDPHIEELYTYVQKILPTLQCIEELDLRDVEPAMLLIPSLSPEGRGLLRELSQTGKLRVKE
jgi:Asp-tRNA(Asn)/Glu-tRNA(Gln) amidotransferase C subunit